MHRAISDVSFTVQPGTIAGFLGVNGAGKTTTMRILSCFLIPNDGTGKVAGFDIIDDPIEVRKRVGYCPEHPPLYNEMTVKAYLKTAAGLRGVPSKQIQERIDYVVEKCGLKDVYSRLIGRLSKGFRQRVGLAQALIHDPPVLILDEPTVGLDPKQVIEIRHLVKSLRGEHTILFSSHVLYEVTQVCDDVIIIHEGKIRAQGSIEELEKGLLKENRLIVRFKYEPDGLVQKYESFSGVKAVEPIPGDHTYRFVLEKDEDIQASLIENLAQESWKLLEARMETLTLEDIFIQLTTGRTETFEMEDHHES